VVWFCAIILRRSNQDARFGSKIVLKRFRSALTTFIWLTVRIPDEDSQSTIKNCKLV